MNLVRIIRLVVNRLLRRTHWFKEIYFPCCSKFWSYNKFNTKIVNLGSSSAVYAFDYSGIDIEAANWAITRNPIIGDLAILKNYYSFLAPGNSTVIFPICPFSSLSGRYDYLDDRYYTFLYPSTLPNFSIHRLNTVMDRYNNPLRHYPLIQLFSMFGRLFNRQTHSMTQEGMIKDADKWYNGWLKEFSINKLDERLSLINRDSIEEYCEYLNKIIEFCQERKINIYITIPPVYKTLRDKFDQKALEILFSDILVVAQSRKVTVLDYFTNSDFLDNKDYFINSFFMSNKGARAFTKRVLEDICAI